MRDGIGDEPPSYGKPCRRIVDVDQTTGHEIGQVGVGEGALRHALSSPERELQRLERTRCGVEPLGSRDR